MRIALVHPTYWPEVRRGSERLIHDIAGYLVTQGAEVTILTSHQGLPKTRWEDGVKVIRGLRIPSRVQPRGFEPYASHAPSAFLSVAVRRFDLVHAFHIPDAYGASWWTHPTGCPLVLSLMGYPDDESIGAFKRRREMLARVGRRASAVHVVSHAAARALKQTMGIQAVVIHNGIVVSSFEGTDERAEQPTIFCAASPADPRKRIPLLAEAFRVLREALPTARLRIAGPIGKADTTDLDVPNLELVGEIGSEVLAQEYARAWVSVLPAAREAFGLVLLESLAAGTPAVGMREGGVPEILDDPRTSVVCDRADPNSLAVAIQRGIELTSSPGIRELCRAHAQRWDWISQIGPLYDRLYANLLEKRL